MVHTPDIRASAAYINNEFRNFPLLGHYSGQFGNEIQTMLIICHHRLVSTIPAHPAHLTYNQIPLLVDGLDACGISREWQLETIALSPRHQFQFSDSVDDRSINPSLFIMTHWLTTIELFERGDMNSAGHFSYLNERVSGKAVDIHARTNFTFHLMQVRVKHGLLLLSLLWNGIHNIIH